MVDMAFGLCGNYFMERVQAKQVKQCFGCSAAAGFIDIKYIFFCEFKNVLWGKSFKHTTCLKKKKKIRSTQNGQKEEDTHKNRLSNTMSGLQPSETNDMM